MRPDRRSSATCWHPGSAFGNVVEHLPCRDRARDARPRLARRAARPAAAVPLLRRGRRRHPAQRFGRRPGRDAGRAAQDQWRAHRARRSLHRPVRGLHLTPDALVGGESLPGRRPRLGCAAQDRGGSLTQAAEPDHLRALLAAESEPESPRPWSSRRSGRPVPVRWIRSVRWPALAHEYGAWLHVDAAWAGVAAVCPSCAGSTTESNGRFLCTNPHKWLLTNFDCMHSGSPIAAR